ncbi:zinc-binding alcohol dehydrogenase [Streptomyces sp. SID8352]|uniref:zinc-dependent alcohol dehydrogenase n=1 Tax=Streptomyces sp. SID8352 TaxID=2690338 RepID=UPI00136DF44E|nr:zinc-binding alcohol dehydrogenase [Streptomyces sp. SID8352]MYU23647.1 zinc-binding dehydrogenase [Streptomyces sp. SID8352]
MHSTRVLFTEPGRVELRREVLPELSGDDLHVRTRMSLISSGTERSCLLGEFERPSHWASWVRHPFAPGYSAVGEVIATGPTAARHRPGDRVVLRRSHQSHAVVSEGSVYPVPDEIGDEAATWFALSAIAQHAVRRTGVLFGKPVAVAGLGPLGQLVLQYAAVAGASEIFAVARGEARLDAATQHGATTVLSGGIETATAAVTELTAGEGVGVAYDVTGAPDALAALAGLTRESGTLVLVGDTLWPGQQVLGGTVLRRAQTVIGIHDSDIPRATAGRHLWDTFAENVKLFFQLQAQGRMKVEDLVTHTFPAAEAEAAYKVVAAPDNDAIGVLLDWREFDR